MSLPLFLKPNFTYDLLRIGKSNDGGYLVGKSSLLSSDNLISFGIYDDWSFEKSFIKNNKNICVTCYDDQLKFIWLVKNALKYLKNIHKKNNFFIFFQKLFILIDYFIVKKKMSFIQKKIVSNDLKVFSKNKKNIFLKVDIEGNEYQILKDILDIESRLTGLVIEFHDINVHLDELQSFLKQLTYLKLIHIHPNNYGGIDNKGDPTIIELSFDRDPIVVSKNLQLPHFLDQRNNIRKNDLTLKFE